jgi:REP element-mobilizing transposase RayT
MWSVAARYALVDAGDQLKGLAEYQQQVNIAANVGYYINRHRIKVNLEFGTNRNTAYNNNDLVTFNYYTRFNMELGI